MKVSRCVLTACFVFACGAAVAPSRGEAVVSASASGPIRAGIDADCRAGRLAAARKGGAGYRTVLLSRTAVKAPAAGSVVPSYGAWKAIAEDNVPVSAPSPFATDAVEAVVVRGALYYATETASDATGDGATVHEYCYRSGKLVRAQITIDDVSEDTVYSRTVYYDATGAPLADSGQQTKSLGRGASQAQKLPASSLAIPAYIVPSRQPFYAALDATLAAPPK